MRNAEPGTRNLSVAQFSFRTPHSAFFTGSEPMKATIRWTGDVSFEGSAESGHKDIMDGPPDHGGKNKGPRPMELVLIGMGGCTAFDVVHILKKSRQQIAD